MSKIYVCTFLFGVILSGIINLTHASVWDDVNQWNTDYETEYSNWIASENVHEKIFSNQNSPYYGIHTDCADTAYALRAIFAFEHNLPFAVKNPSGGRRNQLLTNRTTAFDHLKNQNVKFIAFINDLTELVGTENLSMFDSYPIAINSVNAGSLFLYKIDGNNNTFIRHTYNIKDVNENGSFDVIYSTQSLKYSNLPLIRRKEKDFDELPFSPWGFKRFRWPNLILKSLDQFPKELQASNEQYLLAEKLGIHDFFKLVRTTLSKVVENNDTRFIKALHNLCEEAQSRIQYVDEGVKYNQKINGRCMNYDEYDAYSTPVKDYSLKTQFQRVTYFYNEAVQEGTIQKVPSEFISIYQMIYENSLENRDLLLSFCPIKYGETTIDLGELFSRENANLISSHPNDSEAARWGEDVIRTKCKTWY